MKTKQMLMLTLLFLGVLLSREAQAFYNPSTGRWLNRDPLGEAGGLNVYAFAQNRPVHLIDNLGLIVIGLYGADIWGVFPNAGNKKMADIATRVGTTTTSWGGPLFYARSVLPAFDHLLKQLDTNEDGKYDPNCGDKKDDVKIFGWSWGGSSAVELTRMIRRSAKFRDKEVKVLVTIDPVTLLRGPSTGTVPDNVLFFANFYQTGGDTSYGGPFHGHVLKSSAKRSWQWNVNPDIGPPEQREFIDTLEFGRVSVNHTFIIWRVESEVINALK